MGGTNAKSGVVLQLIFKKYSEKWCKIFLKVPRLAKVHMWIFGGVI